MAGRYLSLEEAAAHLQLAVDEVQRLVDRKKLYPIRDGAALKFKAEDVEAFGADLAAEAGTSRDLPAAPAPEAGPLSDIEPIDLELSDASGVVIETSGQPSAVEVAVDDSLTLDVEALVDLEPVAAAGPPASGSGAIELTLDDAPATSGLSASAIDVGEAAPPAEPAAEAGSLIFDDAGLVDSIISASAASLVVPDAAAVEPEADDPGTLEIDLGEPFDGAAGSLAIGSGDDLVLGSGPRSGQVGSALSGVLDSGVRIEEKALEIEGVQAWDEVDLGVPDEEEPAAKSDAGVGLIGDDGDVLDGDAFDLGGAGDFSIGEEGSASVVMPTDESEDGSEFFPSSAGDASGLSSPNFSAIGSGASIDLSGEPGIDMRFSTLQLVSLICCSLLLLIGGLVTFDLVRTIGSPRGTLLANPILDSLSQTFGWR
jgi:excisionase family DNA binding protein